MLFGSPEEALIDCQPPPLLLLPRSLFAFQDGRCMRHIFSSNAPNCPCAGHHRKMIDVSAYKLLIKAPLSCLIAAAGELSEKSGKQRNVSRLLVYKRGGDASLPAQESSDRALDPPIERTDEDTLSTGHALYANFCSDCHGARAHGGGVIPDLRASGLLGSDAWFEVVLGGALKSEGRA